MTHWGWYWKIKKKHIPKALCSWRSLMEIDSFAMYKKHQIEGVWQSHDKCSIVIPQYKLKAYLQEDCSLFVKFDGGAYVISVEKKTCNYGGFYYFFHCPRCNKRMRKLYCMEGRYLCRKCAHLGYYTQRLRPSERMLIMCRGIKDFLRDRAGALDKRPSRMHEYTFQKFRQKYVKYDQKWLYALNTEVLLFHGPKAEPYLEDYFPDSNLIDAWVDRF